MKGSWASSVLPPVISFVGVTLLAEGLLWGLGVPQYILPRPTAVFVSLYENGAELSLATLRTAQAATLGLACSAVLGILIAVGLSSTRWIQRAFYPYAVFFQTVPIVAIAPMLVIWFQYGLHAVAAAFIVSVFPVIANTLNGMLSTDPALRDLFRLYRAGSVATLVKLKLPSALPNIMTGLRIASGLAVIGSIVGELVAASYENGGGVGIAVQIAMREQKYDKVFAAVLLGSALGLVFFGVINLISHWTLRHWHASER